MTMTIYGVPSRIVAAGEHLLDNYRLAGCKEDTALVAARMYRAMNAAAWLVENPPPSEMIRLLNDPAWRESLKVAETPVEAEYAGVRERLEAMRPAPAGFYSARTGYEGEYRQFFGFRS